MSEPLDADQTTTADLVAALAAAVGTIPKTEKGQFGAFRSIGAVMSAVGAEMARVGLSLSSTVESRCAEAGFLCVIYSYSWQSRFGPMPACSVLVAGVPPKPGMAMTTTGAMASYSWRIAVQNALGIPTEDTAASDPEHSAEPDDASPSRAAEPRVAESGSAAGPRLSKERATELKRALLTEYSAARPTEEPEAWTEGCRAIWARFLNGDVSWKQALVEAQEPF